MRIPARQPDRIRGSKQNRQDKQTQTETQSAEGAPVDDSVCRKGKAAGREKEREHNQGVARTALLFRASQSLSLPRPAMPMQAHSTPLSPSLSPALSLSRWLRSASPKQSQLLQKRGTFLARKFNANCSSDASSDCDDDDDDGVTLRPFTSTRTCAERATENGNGNGQWDWQWV